MLWNTVCRVLKRHVRHYSCIAWKPNCRVLPFILFIHIENVHIRSHSQYFNAFIVQSKANHGPSKKQQPSTDYILYRKEQTDQTSHRRETKKKTKKSWPKNIIISDMKRNFRVSMYVRRYIQGTMAMWNPLFRLWTTLTTTALTHDKKIRIQTRSAWRKTKKADFPSHRRFFGVSLLFS